MMSGWRDISPQQLIEGLESGAIDPGRVVDVRESFEREYYHLPGTLHIPLQSLPERLDELDPDAEWYMLCAHGVRSVYACRYLHDNGYGRLANVSGGIAAAALLLGFQYD